MPGREKFVPDLFSGSAPKQQHQGFDRIKYQYHEDNNIYSNVQAILSLVGDEYFPVLEENRDLDDEEDRPV
jgi:hypothetical protein